MDNGHQNKVMVSFCIASYNRYEVTKELIEELLEINSDRFEIVVSDDKSPDDTAEKLRTIHDDRLKVYENKENVGSMQNIYESLNRGNGEFLFYLNDRDNVKASKINEMIKIFEELEKREVGYGKFVPEIKKDIKFQIYKKGEDALQRFACRVSHPTGYFFRRDCWELVKNKKAIFKEEKYGDYGFTHICAVLALNHDGARIFGDFCDIGRERIDFKKVRSGFYNNRSDKRLWYTPEVQERELKIAYYFLKKIGVSQTVLNKILVDRFYECMCRVVIDYRVLVNQPANSYHYGITPPENTTSISIRNGLYLWNKYRNFIKKVKNEGFLLKEIDIMAVKVYYTFFVNCFSQGQAYLQRTRNEI